MSLNKERGEWVITDPDCIQVRRQYDQECDYLWELAEIRSFEKRPREDCFVVCESIIDLRDLDDETIENMIDMYGYNSSDIPFLHKGEIAEMFFESDNDFDGVEFFVWNDAVAYIERLTGLDLSEYKE